MDDFMKNLGNFWDKPILEEGKKKNTSSSLFNNNCLCIEKDDEEIMDQDT
jgi:hypothetical protein